MPRYYILLSCALYFVIEANKVMYNTDMYQCKNDINVGISCIPRVFIAFMFSLFSLILY